MHVAIKIPADANGWGRKPAGDLPCPYPRGHECRTHRRRPARVAADALGASVTAADPPAGERTPTAATATSGATRTPGTRLPGASCGRTRSAESARRKAGLWP